MKCVPSNIRSAFLSKTVKQMYTDELKYLTQVTADDIEVLGLVRIVRRYNSGCALSDSILDPRGERLYFLLRHGIIEEAGRRLNRFLIANSCRAFWLAAAHLPAWGRDWNPALAYGHNLRLIDPWQGNTSHHLHPSITTAAKEAIAAFVKDAVEEKANEKPIK